MNLREWMFRNKVKCTTLAADLKTSATYISKLKNGQIPPRRKRAIEIEAYTKGEVPISEFGYAPMP